MRGYKRCNVCWRVFHDPEGRYWDKPLPCPICGRTHESWATWPHPGVLAFLRISSRQDKYDGDAQIVALVFTCTAIEALLEEMLQGLLFGKTPAGDLVNLLLEAFQGVPRRERLFKSLRGIGLKDVIESSEFKGFYPRWAKLREVRNSVLHGDYWGDRGAAPLPVGPVTQECLPVFQMVHNDAWDHLEKERGSGL